MVAESEYSWRKWEIVSLLMRFVGLEAVSQQPGLTDLAVNERIFIFFQSKVTRRLKAPLRASAGTRKYGIFIPRSSSSFYILFFLTHVWLFPVTFLSPTVVHINLLNASCFFSRGPEEKLLFPVEKKWEETRPVIISDIPACRKWRECSEPLHMTSGKHTHTRPTQSSVFPNRIKCLTFCLLLFDRLIWWRPGDSRLTSSAISCNISLAKMELFQH